MTTHATQTSMDLPKYDHERLNRLVEEVEKLVALLEDQRLVEPSRLIDIKRELKAIEEH